jgi:cytochrome c oxidase assembly protein subunit 15
VTSTTTTAPLAPLTGWFSTVRALRGWTVASLVLNIVIIVTGAIVRLTGSGLGCATWPQCNGTSYVTRPEDGIHGAIEFGNRTLTFVLIIVAVATLVTAYRVKVTAAGEPTRRLRLLALLVLIGIPFQGVIGGITVLTQLNPWMVSLHLLLSVVLIALCVVMVHDAYDISSLAISPLGRGLLTGIRLLTALVIVLGTVVTGAGPHSGDGGATRNGLSPEFAARIHAGSVWVLLILTVIAYVVTKSSLMLMLLAIQCLQGVIGYVQYVTGLPVLGVVLHMVGVGVLTAATAHVYWRMRDVVRPVEAG